MRVAIASGKGGTGKTMLATNLAALSPPALPASVKPAPGSTAPSSHGAVGASDPGRTPAFD